MASLGPDRLPNIDSGTKWCIGKAGNVASSILVPTRTWSGALYADSHLGAVLFRIAPQAAGALKDGLGLRGTCNADKDI